MLDLQDLRTIIQSDTPLRRVAATCGGEYAGPCPFCGGRDRFRVWPAHSSGTGRWWCRQCSRSGDSVAYLVERGVLTPAQAGAMRRENVHPLDAVAAPEREKPLRLAEPPLPAWQARALQFVTYAETQLGEDRSYPRQELRKWGLNDETIRIWRLGWNPRDLYDVPGRWGLQGKRIYLPRGLVIPHLVKEQPWGIKIRRYVGWQAASDPKYLQPRRNNIEDDAPHDTLFGVNELRSHPPILLLTEGEKDCLLAWQMLRDLVNVASVCGATRGFPARWLDHLLPYTTILVAYDADQAGLAGAARFRGWAAPTHAIQVPVGDDLVDFVQRGGDLRSWLGFHLHRLALAPIS